MSIFCVWQAYMDIRINTQAAKAQYQYKYVTVYSGGEIDRTVNSQTAYLILDLPPHVLSDVCVRACA